MVESLGRDLEKVVGGIEDVPDVILHRSLESCWLELQDYQIGTGLFCE